MRTVKVLIRDILMNPVTWIVVAALVAVTGGWVSLKRQHEQEKEIKGWLMGGESWAYYVPWRTKERNLAFFIRQTGEYPSYDVVLRIQDELKGDRVPGDPIYIAPALRAKRGFDWTEPKQLIFGDKPTRGESYRYTLEISMRSGTVVVQRIQLWEVGGQWQTSSKDIKRNGVQVKPPEDFPEAQSPGFPK